jgi:hypothetical protein
MSDDSRVYISFLVEARFDLEKKPITRQYQAQIEKYEKELAEFSLPELQAECQRTELIRLRFGKPEHALSRGELVKKDDYVQELLELSASELRARYESASEDETMRKDLEAHRFAALTSELRTSYFGEPSEFVHWAALDYWTVDEATSLTMGLNPKFDLWSKIPAENFAAGSWSSRAKKAREDLKKSRRVQQGIQVMGFIPTPMFGLYPGYQEVLRDCAFADAAAEYVQLQDRIRRAIDAGKLGERITPAQYILWASDSGIELPEELKQAVEARNNIPNWKALYDDLSGQYEAASKERDDARRKLVELQSTIASSRETLNSKERRSAQRLILGMAMRKYGYKPNSMRNDVAKLIYSDLNGLELKLDEDTIRKWLRESAEAQDPHDCQSEQSG